MPLRVRDRRPAAAAVELALLLPFLVFVVAIATDWARLLHHAVVVEACARNGALYASDPVAAAHSPYKSLREAAMAEAPGLDPAATVTSAPAADAAGNPAVVVSVSVPFRTLTRFPGVPGPRTLTRSVQMRVAPATTK